MTAIEIVPAEGGWMVRSEAIENELFFRSGASAESAAVRLARVWRMPARARGSASTSATDPWRGEFVVPSLRLVEPASSAAFALS